MDCLVWLNLKEACNPMDMPRQHAGVCLDDDTTAPERRKQHHGSGAALWQTVARDLEA